MQWSDEEVFLPRKGMQLDIGGLGKEFAVDRVMEKAQFRGFRNVLVDFGRDIRVLGAPPTESAWLIGLQEATDPSRCRTGIGLNRHSVATSGNYARGFDIEGKRYGHIIDPRTGRPADTDCISASVIGPTCTEAGVFSTLCILLGSEQGMAFMNRCPQAEVFMQTLNATIRTPGFERHELQSAGVA